MSLGRKYLRCPKAAVGSASIQAMSPVGSSEPTARMPRSCSSRHRFFVNFGVLELYYVMFGLLLRRWWFYLKLMSIMLFLLIWVLLLVTVFMRSFTSSRLFAFQSRSETSIIIARPHKTVTS